MADGNYALFLALYWDMKGYLGECSEDEMSPETYDDMMSYFSRLEEFLVNMGIFRRDERGSLRVGKEERKIETFEDFILNKHPIGKEEDNVWVT